MKRPTLNVCRCSSRASKLLSEFSPETKLRRMKKFLSSPLTKRKNVSHKTFGVVLAELITKDPDNDVPFIVKKLCKYLEDYGLTQEGIFRVSGNTKTVESMRNKFNETGNCNLEDEGDISSVACLLKLFLRELPDPVIPNLLSRHFILAHQENKNDSENNLKHLTRLVCLLPEEHYNLLKYLTKFFIEVSKQKEFNKMTSLALGVVFGPNLFRVSSGLEGLNDQAITNDIVTLFIDNYETVFNSDKYKLLSSPHRLLPSHPALLRLHENVKSLDLSVMNEAFLGCSVSSDASTDNLSQNFASLSITEKRMVQSRIDEVVTQYLLCSSNNCPVLNDPSKNVFRPFSLSEGSESMFSGEKKTKRESLKRSRSHSEVTSLNNDVNLNLSQFSKDDNVFPTNQQGPTPSKHRHECSSRSSTGLVEREPVAEQEGQRNVGLAPQEILSYDSDETHELKRRSERQNQIGTYSQPRIRRRSLSGKKTRSSVKSPTEATPKASKSINDQKNSSDSQEDSPPVVSPRVYGHGQHHDQRHGIELVRSEPVKSSGWKFANLLSASENEGVVPCPRTSHFRSTSIAVAAESSQSSGIKRSDFIAGPSKEPEKDQSVFVKILRSKFYSKFKWLKKKVKNFEKKFEKERGHKPTTSEKASNDKVKEHMDELSKVSKEMIELEQGKELYQLELVLQPAAVEHYEKYTASHPSVKQTLQEIRRILDEQRINSRRPEAVDNMTPQQVQREKVALQKSLLHFEHTHGRPAYIYSDDFVKSLYDRYRCVKRLITKCSSPSCSRISGSELPCIIEDKAMDFTSPTNVNIQPKDPRKKKSGSAKKTSKTDEKHPMADADNFTLEKDPVEISEEASKFQSLIKASGEKHSDSDSSRLYDQSHLVAGPSKYSDEMGPISRKTLHERRTLNPKSSEQLKPSSGFHHLSQFELMKQYQLTNRFKNRLRTRLSTFETNFNRKNQRKIRKDDRGSMTSVYLQYKEQKAKLKLMETLIVKHEKKRANLMST